MINIDSLNKKDLIELNKISRKLQIKYSNLVEVLFKRFRSKDRLILHSIFARDDSSQGLFFKLCILKLIDNKIKHEKINEISLSNKNLATTIFSKHPKLLISTIPQSDG